MASEKYTIGGQVADVDASESFADIPQNRVLMAQKLTANAPLKPQIIEGLTSIEQVFSHYKPSIDIGFETESGSPRQETLHFNGLEDFGIKGITAQSSFLRDLTSKKEQYQKIMRQLKTNKQLKQALADPETKQHILQAIQLLMEELNNAG